VTQPPFVEVTQPPLVDVTQPPLVEVTPPIFHGESTLPSDIALPNGISVVGLKLPGTAAQPATDIPIDIRDFDILHGHDTSIDEMILINDSRKNALHAMGIDTVLELYAADTTAIAGGLGISEIQVAEYKDGALESMKRAARIDLDPQEYDLGQGMSMSVEEVHNIGRVRGDTLRLNGFSSVADIANTDDATLANMLSISQENAGELIEDARGQMRK